MTQSNWLTNRDTEVSSYTVRATFAFLKSKVCSSSRTMVFRVIFPWLSKCWSLNVLITLLSGRRQASLMIGEFPFLRMYNFYTLWTLKKKKRPDEQFFSDSGCCCLMNCKFAEKWHEMASLKEVCRHWEKIQNYSLRSQLWLRLEKANQGWIVLILRYHWGKIL